MNVYSRIYSYSSKKDVSKAETKEAGEKLLVSLYGGKVNNSLDQICLYKFDQKIASNNKVVQPEYLFPTSDAAGFHSFRVYYQVQSWKEKDHLNPEDWGWKEKKKENFSRSTQGKMQHQQVYSS